MKNKLPIRVSLLVTVFGMLAFLQAHGQMKIGNHPTSIQPSSILELESNNQALRLTQGDTGQVNAIITAESDQNGVSPREAAEGMIMYQKSDSSIYMRTQGFWRKVVSINDVDSSFWNLRGNSGTDSLTSFLGTLDKEALNIGANGQKYLIIHSNGIINMLGDSLFANSAGFEGSVVIRDSLKVNDAFNVTTDTVYVGKPLSIYDSIVIKGLENALSSDTAVLVLGSNGMVRKMSLDSIGIRTINSVGGTSLHLRFDTVTAGDHTGPWIDSTSEKGLSTLVLNIPDASPFVRGLVNDSTQAFSGAKSFGDSVAIGTINPPNSGLQVANNVSMGTKIVPTATGNYDMASNVENARYRTIIFDVSSTVGGVTVNLPDASTIDGRIYTFKKIGSQTDAQIQNPLTINTQGSQLIDGDGTSYTIYNNFTAVTLQAQAGNWYIVR